MKNAFLPFVNPVKWVKAYRFHKQNSKYDKSCYDLELYLYSRILKNDMLHFGYFNDIDIKPEKISIELLEEAQINYANHIIEKIEIKDKPILDVGCGMGGLAKLLLGKGLTVEVVTPNKNQIDYIKCKYNNLPNHHCKFERFESTQMFGTIINSESLQYINLNEAISKIDKLLLPGGRWIVVDFFRIQDTGVNRSGHMLGTFKGKLDEHGWKIVHEQDITLNVLPTLSFLNMYLDRFIFPLKHYAFEKLRFKKAWLYYLTGNLREKIESKIAKECAAIDVTKFLNEKKYLFFVIEKK